MLNYNMSASLRFNVFTPIDYVQHVCIVCGIFVKILRWRICGCWVYVCTHC